MKLIFLFLMLAACAPVDDVTFNKSWFYDHECYYDIDGEILNKPCQPLSLAKWGAEFHKSALLPRYNPADYYVEMVGFHTESEAGAACKSITGKWARACAIVDRRKLQATIFTVYGDEESKRHEITHIQNDY